MGSKETPNVPGRLEKGLARIFSNAEKHRVISDIIQRHLIPVKDIRKIAFSKINLSGAENILDLGCGFGFSTEGLKGFVNKGSNVTGIDIHSHYESYFLDSCETAGFKGIFRCADARTIKAEKPETFDLVISSFSLYFFPDMIELIARTIKKSGHLVAFTHAIPHMIELTSFVKNYLLSEGIGHFDVLPYEKLIGNFSDENGITLLSPWFRKVEKYKCKNTLVFKPHEFEDLLTYLTFKEPYFIPDNNHDTEPLIHAIAEEILRVMKREGEFKITKDDCIYICSKPKHSESGA
jgi:ubiquinone/menaquinone biosynthesis C-methylase UbiE